MLSSSNRFDDGWRIVTSDILVCKSCGKFHDGFPKAFVRPENKKCDCGSRELLHSDVADILTKLNKITNSAEICQKLYCGD